MAKIFTTYSTLLWMQLKDTPGTLPDGKLVLGIAFDSFKLFWYRFLLDINSINDQIVMTTCRLIIMVQ